MQPSLRLDETQNRESSTIVRTVQSGRVVYQKRYLHGDLGLTEDVVRRRFERECKLNDRLHASGLFSQRLGIVPIISTEPAQALLVMGEVPGCPLETLIFNQFRQPNRESLRAFFLAGRWLQQFQKLGMTNADCEVISDLNSHNLVEYCKLRLTKLVEVYKYLNLSLIERLLNRLDYLVCQSDESDRRFVWSHGDYALGNIIWDGRTLTPIDFGMAQGDFPLADVTYLIHRLEMQQIYRPWKHWRVGIWKRALLRGYGRDAAEMSPMYRALMIRHQICRMLTYVRRPPRDIKQRLHDCWVRGTLRYKLNCSAWKSQG